jgi:Family of unknown function (DUF6194)
MRHQLVGTMKEERMDEAAIRQVVADHYPGVDVQIASEENGAPEMAWGDTFFIHDPNRNLEGPRRFPFATIVTKDYGDFDNRSNLNRPGVFRLNVGVSSQTYRGLFPTDGDHDFTALDTLMPHPVYGGQHWVSVLNPSEATFEKLRPLLDEAYRIAVRRNEPRGRSATRSSRSRSSR